MLTLDQFLAFLAAAVLLTLSPGPDNMMVLSIGIAKGRLRGIAFGLGCAFGCLSHTLLAVVGVSALIAASPVAFTALKVCGGLYLAWMGWHAIRSRGGARVDRAEGVAESARTLFFKGMLANAINPKVALFFLSFLPQFVAAGRGDANVQIALLGLTFTLQAAVLFGLLGFFSGTIGAWLGRRPAAGMWLDRIAGAVFIGLGLRLIVAR
ncbi:LysE family translocator [Massilia sp. YIM B02763]|uniref:LysE family translocator n=1 Tax=Massilia sp. YIM B02763 TaxID=3050130 RepID=UPI0025B68B69|nr:LysE family translocator [Massilia sp. YIM B02763]MDN4054880.1 LysE family translocator [Massilia sp. YIM B02763]